MYVFMGYYNPYTLGCVLIEGNEIVTIYLCFNRLASRVPLAVCPTEGNEIVTIYLCFLCMQIVTHLAELSMVCAAGEVHRDYYLPAFTLRVLIAK